nr:MAG TPA: Common central domain of tyrosinase [Bacteriophage sp.]
MKSERHFQRGRNTTAIFWLVHCYLDTVFVQKVLFVRIGTD